ncbi:MAG: NAD-dependent epimerase/dehydratase family protein [Bacteroidota bacterium]
MMKIAIVGSNGFIAKHLASALSKAAQTELHLFGRSKSNLSGTEANYHCIDLNHPESFIDDFKGMDLVYYLSSDSIPSSSWHNPYKEVEQNLLPFLNFMEVAAKQHISKVAFVSSAGTVYGTTQGKVDETSATQPFSPYGIMKLHMEHMLNYYKTKYNIQFDIYRVSNVYGEGQNTAKGLGIINTFLEHILQLQKVKVFGDGNITRNYIYVKDVAQLMLHSISNSNTSDVFNVSSDNTYSINDLINIMKQVVHEDFKVHYEQSRQSDNAFIDLDHSKISKLHPEFKFTSIEEGISKTYNYIKSLQHNIQ